MPNDALRDSLAERRWLISLSEGDPKALGGLYEMYGERIFRYTFRMLGNRTDAEDATVVKLWIRTPDRRAASGLPPIAYR